MGLGGSGCCGGGDWLLSHHPQLSPKARGQRGRERGAAAVAPPRPPKSQLVPSRRATLRAAATGQEGRAGGGTSPVITPHPSLSRLVGGAEGGQLKLSMVLP